MKIIRENLSIILLLVVTIIFSLIPILQTYEKVGENWKGVPPEYTSDSLYYLSRMEDVVHGHIFIGNPYILEHRNDVSPSFFVADWLASVPLLLGLPLFASIIWNIIFWSVILNLLCYLVFCELGLSKSQSVGASILSYLQVYWLMLRPVAMQTVFPFFVLFLFSFILWWKYPDRKKYKYFLIFSSVFTFYIYTYLWQIVAVSFFLSYIYLFWQKDFSKIKSLIFINILTFFTILPVVFYSLKQIHSPYYWESMARIGLVFTHIPTLDLFNYGKWVILLGLLCLLLFFFRSNKTDKFFRFNFLPVFFISGLALLLTSGSNIILGKELETANHIGRFITLWTSIFFLTFLVYIWNKKEEFFHQNLYKKIAIIFLILIITLGYVRNYYLRSIPLVDIGRLDMISIQEYAEPLEWFTTNANKDEVIWVLNQSLADYVPILTKQYVLFHPAAGLQIMPSYEVEERYLLSHSLENMTVEDLKKDYRKYSGVGNAVHQANTINRKVKICLFIENILPKITKINCGDFVDSYSIRGEKYFESLLQRFSYITKNRQKFLDSYNVSYILLDKSTDNMSRFSNLPPVYKNIWKNAWQNDRFVILKRINK